MLYTDGVFSLKSVVLLIGAKGAGKTTLGELLGKRLNARFLDVERLLIEYCEKHSIHPNEIPSHGFGIEFDEIEKILSNENIVIAEATGSSEYLPQYIDNIKEKFKLVAIKIECNPEICIQRIKSRSNQNNFHVDEETISKIYTKTEAFELDWAFKLDTTNSFDIESICEQISKYVAIKNV